MNCNVNVLKVWKVNAKETTLITMANAFEFIFILVFLKDSVLNNVIYFKTSDLNDPRNGVEGLNKTTIAKLLECVDGVHFMDDVYCNESEMVDYFRILKEKNAVEYFL